MEPIPVALPLEYWQALLNYLGARPYVEVGGLIPQLLQAIHAAKSAAAEEAKEPDGP